MAFEEDGGAKIVAKRPNVIILPTLAGSKLRREREREALGCEIIHPAQSLKQQVMAKFEI